ncbi:piggyBac transposable element-derived protein 3-like [Drosophila mojavensis]|uniref:piggyBac transposable element-derived protein 3-like n=1 Tax=Drosophila mojavensis TaxID=7230 RepID=UPI001CD0AAD2|nr:piggyBac transposable element-derived protein 3-like [Drosophila mojavensis]
MANRVRFKLSDLTDEQLLELFENVPSDAELSESSDDEEDDLNVAETLIAAVEYISTISFACNDEENVPDNGQSEPIRKSLKRQRSPLPTIKGITCVALPSSGGFTGAGIESIAKEPSKILWRQQFMQLHVNNVAFQGDSSLPAEIMNLKTPSEIFRYFFDAKIMDMIVEETMRAALVENISTRFQMNIEDVHHYIGILIYMSIYRYPSMRSYWGRNAFLPIASSMNRTKFETIKQHLSLRDESQRIKKGQPGYDPLFRTRRLVDYLNTRFDSVPKQPRLCVDEQMCSTKMKHHLRQYMPNKPYKWGIKLFVLCDSYGYAYRFEIYSGAGDNIVLPGHPDLGASANIVVRLTKTVQSFKHHIVYFDNFYTSLPLMVYLRAKGIYSLGTVRANRIPNCKLPDDTIINKKPRGFSTEFVGTSYGVEVSNVLWKDNKAVRLLSTYVGVKPFATESLSERTLKIDRYDRKKKQHIEIDCPQIIREYNSHMGGVDLMDGLMGRYHIKAKTKDAATRIFYHCIDMAATNAYILYRRIQKQNAISDKLMELPDFRELIAEGLVAFRNKAHAGRPVSTVSLQDQMQSPSLRTDRSPFSQSPRARPSQLELKLGKKTLHPIAELRFDQVNHFPNWLDRDNKRRCKLCKSSQTQCICEKCNLHLCCTSTKNCFKTYHMNNKN